MLSQREVTGCQQDYAAHTRFTEALDSIDTRTQTYGLSLLLVQLIKDSIVHFALNVADDFSYIVLEQEVKSEGELLLIAAKHNIKIKHTHHVSQQWRRICTCYLYSR